MPRWGAALKDSNKEMIMILFEAALSVPIRLRLCPDADSLQLLSLLFSETAFSAAAASGADVFWQLAEKVNSLSGFKTALAQNWSVPKLRQALREYGVTFKGKAATEATAKALNKLAPLVGDEKCRMAYSLMEKFCPELRESTLLMRIAQFVATRATGVGQEQAQRDAMVCVFDCLRVARLF